MSAGGIYIYIYIYIYSIYIYIESVSLSSLSGPRGESLNCLCLFRKQGSAVVHQNGPIEIRAGSRCLIYREILFLSFSSSLREIVTHRFDVDSPRFRAESSSRPIDGKTEKKRGGRKEGEERERERETLAVESRTGCNTTVVPTNIIVRDARLNPRRPFRLKLMQSASSLLL